MSLAAIVLGQSPQPRVAHLFVALADNEHQGIAKVPAKIGHGDDADNNLYWGCDEGVRGVFGAASPTWRLALRATNPTSAILERRVYRNADRDAWLVADAYRGIEIKKATTDFLDAATGRQPGSLAVTLNGRQSTLPIGGGAALVAYIGHNGLMDFRLDAALSASPSSRGVSGKPAIVLCCMSENYFAPLLRSGGARPLLLTTQLMYPGAFLLKAALDGWLRGESPAAMVDRAARAYSENQKISFKSARGVFSIGN